MSYFLDRGAARVFDQNDICNNYRGIDASDFGFCKALVVLWIKRWRQGQDFFDSWLLSGDANKKKGAELSVVSLAKKEVLSADQIMMVASGSDMGTALMDQKDNWHTQYFRSNGIHLSSVEEGYLNEGRNLAPVVNLKPGYSILYIFDDAELGHAVGIWNAGDSDQGQMFDPNFGVFDIPGGGWTSWDHLFYYMYMDYEKLFAMTPLVGKLTRYKLEHFGG